VTSGGVTDTLTLTADPGTFVAYFDGHGGTAIGYANVVIGTPHKDILGATASPDLFNGLARTDLVSYAAALTGVTANLANPAFDTGWAGGDNYTSIEGLIGSQFADVLTGNARANILRGGLGRDVLTGGGGPDHFDFNSIAESVVGPQRDVIRDLHDSQHDRSTSPPSTRTPPRQAIRLSSSSAAIHSRTTTPCIRV
jgi:Ca2+-binding RTX toxin-like protein